MVSPVHTVPSIPNSQTLLHSSVFVFVLSLLPFVDKTKQDVYIDRYTDQTIAVLQPTVFILRTGCQLRNKKVSALVSFV